MEVTFSDDGNATTLLAELVSTSAPTVVLQSHNFVPTGSASSYLHTFTGVAPGSYIIKVSKNTVSGPCDIVATLSVVVEECPSPIECGTIDESWVEFVSVDCPAIGYNYYITVPSTATWATGSDLYVTVRNTNTNALLISTTQQFAASNPSSSNFWTFNWLFGGGQLNATTAPAGTSVTLTLGIQCGEDVIERSFVHVVQECPVDPEPIDCVVSDWSDWSECVEGVQTRTRTVITPASGGGIECPELSESRDCENPPCPPPTDLTATISE
jgi:hypothetical protein